jgi:flavin reductase (DIM6/NTAB) family NADH-FMN oxidoreductase RutF
VPRIKECAGWIECKLKFEKEFNDRVLIVGSVVECGGKEGSVRYISEGIDSEYVRNI